MGLAGPGETGPRELRGAAERRITERAFIVPPGSQLGPISAEERRKTIAASAVAGHYEKAVDRESAFEKLKARTAEKQDAQGGTPESGPRGVPKPAPAAGNVLNEILFGKTGPRGGQHDGLAQTLAKSAVRTMGSQVGREIIRGVLGSIFGKRS